MEYLIVDRIKLLLEDKGLSPSAFADVIDIQRSSMSHILSGRNNPSLDMIQKILSNFPDINSSWLLTGKGKMKQLDLFGSEDGRKVTEPAPVVIATKPKNEEPIKVEKVEPELLPEQKIIAPVLEPSLPPPTLKETYTPLTTPLLKITDAPAKPEIQKQLPTADNKQIEKIFVFYTDKTFSVYKPE